MGGFTRLISHRTIDWLRWVYGALVAMQLALVALYEMDVLPPAVALTGGLMTSLTGPAFSLTVSLHVFAHRRMSRGRDIATVALTYFITCASFAILYVIIDDHNAHAFALPAGNDPPLTFGTALYFSIVTITTTGFGDIAPASGLARFATCLEIITGMLYQVFIFSLAASLLNPASPAPNPAPAASRRRQDPPY